MPNIVCQAPNQRPALQFAELKFVKPNLRKPQGCNQRPGLAEVRELVFRPPGIDADRKTEVEVNNKKLNR